MIKPMLASRREAMTFSDDWIFEIKYDGFRAILTFDGSNTTLQSRRGHDMSPSYPEITEAKFETPVVLDGELIASSSKHGDSRLAYIQARNNVTKPRKIELLTKQFPVTFVVFDILSVGDKRLAHKQLMTRKAYLKELSIASDNIVVSDYFNYSEYDTVWDFVQTQKLEGLVAKRKESIYVEGTRSPAWVKMKW